VSCCGGLIHGASQIVQTRLGIGVVDDETFRARAKLCYECTHAVPCLGLIGRKCQCEKCGCVIREKIQRAAESCPLPEPRWKAVP